MYWEKGFKLSKFSFLVYIIKLFLHWVNVFLHIVIPKSVRESNTLFRSFLHTTNRCLIRVVAQITSLNFAAKSTGEQFGLRFGLHPTVSIVSPKLSRNTCLLVLQHCRRSVFPMLLPPEVGTSTVLLHLRTSEIVISDRAGRISLSHQSAGTSDCRNLYLWKCGPVVRQLTWWLWFGITLTLTAM